MLNLSEIFFKKMVNCLLFEKNSANDFVTSRYIQCIPPYCTLFYLLIQCHSWFCFSLPIFPCSCLVVPVYMYSIVWKIGGGGGGHHHQIANSSPISTHTRQGGQEGATSSLFLGKRATIPWGGGGTARSRKGKEEREKTRPGMGQAKVPTM